MTEQRRRNLKLEQYMYVDQMSENVFSIKYIDTIAWD